MASENLSQAAPPKQPTETAGSAKAGRKPVKSYRRENLALAEKFDDYLGARGFSPHTIRAYGRVVADFHDFIRSESVIEVEPTVVRQYISYLYSRGCAPQSISCGVYALRSFFDFLGRAGLVDLSPLRLIPNRRLPKRLPRFLTEKEMDRFLAAAAVDPRDRAIAEVVYASGSRIAELASIRLENIDFQGRSIRVLGKGNKEGMVYFGKPAARAIKKHLRGRTSGFLFQNDGIRPQQGTVVLVTSKRRGKGYWWGRWTEYKLEGGQRRTIRRGKYLGPASKIRTREQAWRRFKMLVKVPTERSKPPGPLGVRSLRNIIYRIAQRAGLGHINPHAIRHSFATHLLDRGAELLYISKLMRHKNISTTAIYTHVTTAGLRAVYRRCHPRA